MNDISMVNPQLRAYLGTPLAPRPETIGAAPGTAGVGEAAAPVQGQKTFADMLKDSLSEVNRLQNEADVAIDKLVTGEKPDIHSTLLALQKADLSFQVMMEVRNKLLSAYQDLIKLG